MSANNSNKAFLTENHLPTLNNHDYIQAKKLKELCRNMEELVESNNDKLQNIMQNQQSKFFKAFKVVIETMFSEFQDLQKKFEEYVAYHEKETEVVNAQNKLVFFRKECQILNQLCNNLKYSNDGLKKKIQELENEIYYQKVALIKQTTAKQHLQNQVWQLKQALDSCNPSQLLETTDKNTYKSSLITRVQLNKQNYTQQLVDSENGVSSGIKQSKTTTHQQTTQKLLQQLSKQQTKQQNSSLDDGQQNFKYKNRNIFYNTSFKARSQSRQRTNDYLETTIKSMANASIDKEQIGQLYQSNQTHLNSIVNEFIL